jgi:hypothetical protein
MLTIALVDLVEELRDRDFALSIRHYVLVHDLVMLVIADRGLDVELNVFETLFGPVLCTSPYEQARFAGVFREWAERLKQRMATPVDDVIHPAYMRRQPFDETSSEQLRSELDDVVDRAKVARRRVLLIGVAVIVVVLVATAWVYLRSQ